jgi:hypothetical protein
MFVDGVCYKALRMPGFESLFWLRSVLVRCASYRVLLDKTRESSSNATCRVQHPRL